MSPLKKMSVKNDRLIVSMSKQKLDLVYKAVPDKRPSLNSQPDLLRISFTEKKVNGLFLL